jgi:hypothetical protein
VAFGASDGHPVGIECDDDVQSGRQAAAAARREHGGAR